MKYFTLPLAATAIALTMFSVSANATGRGNGSANGPTYNETNNDYSTTNNPVANGGNGGTGVGIGGDSDASAASKSSAQSKSDAKATSGSISLSDVDAKTGDVDSEQNTNVTIEGDNYEAPEIPVASAYAAGLTSSNGTCMGSSSGGAQGMSFGISIGSTWMDSDCDRRYDAATLKSLGLPEAAAALMCQKAEVKESMKRSLDSAMFAKLCGEPKEAEKEAVKAGISDPAEMEKFRKHGWFTGKNGAICNSISDNGACAL